MQPPVTRGTKLFLNLAFVIVLGLSWILFGLAYILGSTHTPEGDFFGGLAGGACVYVSIFAAVIGLVGLLRKDSPRLRIIAGMLISPLGWFLGMVVQGEIKAKREQLYYEQRK